MIQKKDFKNAKAIILTFIALYYLYPFSLEIGLGKVIHIAYLAVPVLYIFYRYKYVTEILSGIKGSQWLKLSLIVLGLSCAYALLISAFSGDFSFVSESFIKPIWKFIRFFFIYLLSAYIYQKKNTFYHFVRTLANATAIYVLFTLFMIVSSGFRNYWLSLVAPNLHILYAWQDFGRIGLMGRTNADTSLLITLILIGVCISNKIYKKFDFLYVITVLIMLVGNFLYGRLGFALSIIVILAFFGVSVVKHLNRKMLKWAITLIFTFAIAVLAYSKLVNGEIFNQIVKLAFEPIQSLMSSNIGEISLGYSGDELGTMYFWMGLGTFLIGDGYYQTLTGSRYMQTDPAFMRKILFGGILQITLMYISGLLLVKLLYSKFKKIDRRTFRCAAFLLVFTFLLGEAKDTIFTNWYVICLMFVIALTNDQLHDRKVVVDKSAIMNIMTSK